MKDKITLGYIIAIISVLAIVTLYFAKLDFNDMNSNIKASSVKAYKTGKDYSSKLYNLAVSSLHKEEDLNRTISHKEIVKVRSFEVRKVKPANVLNDNRVVIKKKKSQEKKKALKSPIVIKKKILIDSKAELTVKNQITVKPNKSVSKNFQVKGSQ